MGVLALMFIGAVNYEASLAFAMVFWLIGLFILSILYTFRNLSGLHISAVPGSSIFVGEYAEINVILTRYGKRIYEAIQLNFPGSRNVIANLIENTEERSSLFIVANRRGWFSPGRLTISTIFPFGICRAWSLLDLDLRCLVYPKPCPAILIGSLLSNKTAGIPISHVAVMIFMLCEIISVVIPYAM